MITAPARTTLLLPKNRGLADHARAAAVKISATPEAVGLQELRLRGEDVPFVASELARAGQHVIAITGEDLLKEWLLGGGRLFSTLQLRRLLWDDPTTVYGKPALCAIGPPKLKFARGDTMRVGLCRRYRNLTEQYVCELRAAGIFAKSFAVEGTLETLLDTGIVDVVVDIVMTGRTMHARGLVVHQVIFKSNLIVLESGNDTF